MAIRNNLALHTDPYLRQKGLKEVAVCKNCGAIYHHKRWSICRLNPQKEGQELIQVTCPACQKKGTIIQGGSLHCVVNF